MKLNWVNKRNSLVLVAAASALVLNACGGGGGGGSESTPAVSAQKCSVTNPYRFDADSTTTNGTLTDEKAWLKKYVTDSYLWYREIPVVNAADASFSDENHTYQSIDSYFEALLTQARTASGAKRDKFSFTSPTKDWNTLISGGSSLSYGLEWHFVNRSNPRVIRVAYVETGSPAAANGLQRGDTVVSIDGVSVYATTTADVNVLSAGLWPSTNAAHTFVVSRASVESTITLSAAEVTTKPVFKTQTLDVSGQKVGYMVFNDHIGSAEQPLIDAFTQFKSDGVNDLVLDLRYNGGGYLHLASQVAYMIAGSSRTAGKVFEEVRYNDKRSNKNYAQEFRSQSCFVSGDLCSDTSKTLPSVNLNRVFVLVSGSTCSASEAIINGLQGIDVEVHIVGKTTCGKPYGFNGKDNCGVSYFPMEFEGVNAKGQGGYSDGIAASCVANDDFDHGLGDVNEGMLKAALQLRSGTCPATKNSEQIDEGYMLRNPLRENRILIDRE